MSERDEGPKSELARYAFGYSDKKPSVTYWVVQAIVAFGALAAILGWWGRP
jgi:hypothetical protein